MTITSINTRQGKLKAFYNFLLYRKLSCSETSKVFNFRSSLTIDVEQYHVELKQLPCVKVNLETFNRLYFRVFLIFLKKNLAHKYQGTLKYGLDLNYRVNLLIGK